MLTQSSGYNPQGRPQSANYSGGIIRNFYQAPSQKSRSHSFKLPSSYLQRPTASSFQDQSKFDTHSYTEEKGSRMIYQNIIQPITMKTSKFGKGIEWEKVQEENISLKEAVNEIKVENNKLKTRNMALEKEIGKLSKTIEEFEQCGIVPLHNRTATEGHLIINLKTQLKQTQQWMQVKEQELEKYRKSLKSTKIQELEIEKKGFQDETIRLRSMLQQIMVENVQNERNEYECEQLQLSLKKQQILNNQMQKSQQEKEQSLLMLNSKCQQLSLKLEEQTKLYKQLQTTSKQNEKHKNNQIQKLRTEVQQLQILFESSGNLKPTSKAHIKRPSTQKFKKSLSIGHQPQKLDTVDRALPVPEPEQQSLSSIFESIKYRLGGFGVRMRKIDEYIFDSLDDQQDDCEKSLVHRNLCKAPFKLNDKEALLLTDYLFLREGRVRASNSCNKALLRAILLKGIGLWPSYDSVEQKVLDVSLKHNLSSISFKKLLAGQSSDLSSTNLLKFINEQLKNQNLSQLKNIEEAFLLAKIMTQSNSLHQLNIKQFMQILSDFEEYVDAEQVVTPDELQRYYEAINDKQTLTDKQLCWQQFNLLNFLRNKSQDSYEDLFDNRNYFGGEDDEEMRRYYQEQLLNSGCIRSYTEPDPLQMLQLIDCSSSQRDTNGLKEEASFQKQSKQSDDDELLFENDDDDNDVWDKDKYNGSESYGHKKDRNYSKS